MRKILLAAITTFICLAGIAQVQSPVKWSFSAKKITAETYEIHLTATIDNSWHIYSQSTPDGGPSATVVKFSKNPLLVFDGQLKEVGKMEQHFEKLFDVEVKQYSSKVDFVQVVKVKNKAKTSVRGSVEFMVCNNSQCLPPRTEQFNIPLK